MYPAVNSPTSLAAQHAFPSDRIIAFQNYLILPPEFSPLISHIPKMMYRFDTGADLKGIFMNEIDDSVEIPVSGSTIGVCCPNGLNAVDMT